MVERSVFVLLNIHTSRIDYGLLSESRFIRDDDDDDMSGEVVKYDEIRV